MASVKREGCSRCGTDGPKADGSGWIQRADGTHLHFCRDGRVGALEQIDPSDPPRLDGAELPEPEPDGNQQ